jgi:hypothetical protein
MLLIATAAQAYAEQYKSCIKPFFGAEHALEAFAV